VLNSTDKYQHEFPIRKRGGGQHVFSSVPPFVQNIYSRKPPEPQVFKKTDLRKYKIFDESHYFRNGQRIFNASYKHFELFKQLRATGLFEQRSRLHVAERLH
jgi:hypothetical protein